jgi:hypothetical protein
MYNAHSYLGTDKIQTYKKNTCVGRIGYVLIYFLVSNSIYTKYNEKTQLLSEKLGVWIMHLILSIEYGDIQGIK